MSHFNTFTHSVFFALLTTANVQLAHAETDYQKIDTELNLVYQQALKSVRDPLRLKTSQRDWLKYIKSDCDSNSFNLGGSYGLMIAADFDECIHYEKSERTKYLKTTYLHNS